MILGEMALLITSVFVMTGLAKKVTRRLGVNDFIATFFIFLIVVLNVRGGIRMTRNYTLSLGGVLSVVVSLYMMLKRSERGTDILFALLSAIACAGIAFAYTLHFSETVKLNEKTLALLLSVLVGLWSAFAARRTFAACFFSALTGSFLGITTYLIFFRNSGNIGGSYTFAVMWLGAIFGLILQYLLTYTMRAVGSPRADSYFEAGEMRDEREEKKKED